MFVNFPLIGQLNMSSQDDLNEVIETLKKLVANNDDGSDSAVKLETAPKAPARDLD